MLVETLRPHLQGLLNISIEKVLRNAEEKGTNAVTCSFDISRVDTGSSKICGGSLTLIPAGEQFERCSYCAAPYKRAYMGRPCSVCGIGEVGKQVMGMEFRKKF